MSTLPYVGIVSRYKLVENYIKQDGYYCITLVSVSCLQVPMMLLLEGRKSKYSYINIYTYTINVRSIVQFALGMYSSIFKICTIYFT
jgi:hypothetical protein